MKALVVDDSRVVRTVTTNILEELGIASDTAENGKIAIEKISHETFDFIILDWNMPELDGMGFLKLATEENLIKDTKIILCTTETEFDKITHAISMGAHEYIMKPYNKDIVEDKLKILGLL